jgi:hypothetical protein
VLEIIAISNFHKKPGMILLIDFSKAFDSINHEFIYESLNFFNFGPYFVKIVKTMLNSRKCNLMIDGYPTKQCSCGCANDVPGDVGLLNSDSLTSNRGCRFTELR